MVRSDLLGFDQMSCSKEVQFFAQVKNVKVLERKSLKKLKFGLDFF